MAKPFMDGERVSLQEKVNHLQLSSDLVRIKNDFHRFPENLDQKSRNFSTFILKTY